MTSKAHDDFNLNQLRILLLLFIFYSYPQLRHMNGAFGLGMSIPDKKCLESLRVSNTSLTRAPLSRL